MTGGFPWEGEEMWEDLAAPLLSSVLLGSLYTLMALGLTMTYAVTRVPNFAHAELVTVGAYAAVAISNGLGRGLVESLAAASVVSAAVAMASDEVVFKPLFRRGATPIHLLVASIGVGLVIRYTLTIFANAYDLLNVKSVILAQPLAAIGRGALTTLHVMVLPTAAVAVVALHLVFTRTKLGKAMRAMAANFDLARISGIRTGRVRRFTWAIAGGLAGMSGGFWSVYSPINPETGWSALLWIFAASILGGFVSFYGTIAGGYIVGFAENFGITVANRSLGVDLAYKPLIALAIIVVVFLFRPTGLTGIGLMGLRAWVRRWLARLGLSPRSP